MIYTELVKKAMEICLDAHRGQFDKGGYPYVFHPIHIAEQMDTEDEIIVALLHDVLEMSHYSIRDFMDAGFSTKVIHSLCVLTRFPEDPYLKTYEEYIENIKGDAIATKVKLADLKHNLDTTRLHTAKLSDPNLYQSLMKRYRKAVELLES